MEKRAEQPALYITGQGRIGVETAGKLAGIVSSVHSPALGGLVLYRGEPNMADMFRGNLERTGSREEAVMIHVFSYDMDNAQVIADEIAYAGQQFPEVFHFGLVLKHVNSLSSRDFNFIYTEQLLPNQLDIPLTVLDEGKSLQIQEERATTTILKPEDIVFYGLAGLYKVHTTFPGLNPYTPRRILEKLTDGTNLVGISVGEAKWLFTPFRLPFWPFWQLPFLSGLYDEGQFKNAVYQIIDDALSKKWQITPFKRKEEAKVDVLAIQLPVYDNHQLLGERTDLQRFKDWAASRCEDNQIPEDTLVVLFSRVSMPIHEEVWVPSTAALFYPAQSN